MRKNFYTLIIFCLIVPFGFLLDGCNQPVIHYIQIRLQDNEYGIFNEVEREFGDTQGLDKFTITAFFTNGDQKDIANECELTITPPSQEEITFEQYKNKVATGTLESGYWTINISYKKINSSLTVHILKQENNNNYELKIFSLLSGEEEYENRLTYGTKYSGVQLVVTSNDVALDSSCVSNLYILNDDAEYTAELKPSLDNVTVCDSLEELTPNTYYVCVLITDSVYADKFTNFVQLTIQKSKIEIDGSSLMLDWSFNIDTPYENVTFEQI